MKYILNHAWTQSVRLLAGLPPQPRHANCGFSSWYHMPCIDCVDCWTRLCCVGFHDASEMDNDRPISTLPVLSKIMEKHVRASLYNYLCTTIYYINTILNFTETADVVFNSDKNMITSAVFIDYRKAFDTVSHIVLLRKLGAYDLSAETMSWFTSYLEGRQQYVCMG